MKIVYQKKFRIQGWTQAIAGDKNFKPKLEWEFDFNVKDDDYQRTIGWLEDEGYLVEKSIVYL